MSRFVLTVIVTIIVSNQATLGTAYHDVAGKIDNVGISGGEVISIETAPFMVALWHKPESENQYDAFCGGSIIHERFILTAAHCFSAPLPLSSIKVSMGSAKLKGKDRVLHKVKNKFCRSDYLDDPPFHYDICLLHLTKPVEFGPKVAKIGLPTEDFDLEQGTEVNVTGWGATDKRRKRYGMQNNLRQATVPIVSEENCRDINEDYHHINGKQICAGSRGHDACYGDSGGPLTYNNIQIGVISFGEQCSSTSSGVGVYTRISSFVKWIEDIIMISENLP